ncbi:hypothetical protein [Clostridium collagenovorans]|nr:hypothetical protein [Clostridium collagenovorans]
MNTKMCKSIILIASIMLSSILALACINKNTNNGEEKVNREIL